MNAMGMNSVRKIAERMIRREAIVAVGIAAVSCLLGMLVQLPAEVQAQAAQEGIARNRARNIAQEDIPAVDWRRLREGLLEQFEAHEKQVLQDLGQLLDRQFPPPNEAWDFLRSRHDQDGDGEISRTEYDRGAGAYQRLDRNGDGILTIADFAPSRRRGARPAEMREMYMDSQRMAPRILHRYFQSEDEGVAPNLTLDEFQLALVSYDANDDGQVSREEFMAIAQERGARPIAAVPEYDRYRHLIAVADANADQFLQVEELVEFFRACDKDSDSQLSGSEVGRQMPGAGGGRGRGGFGSRRGATGGRPPEGGVPQVGEVAPDFELTSPAGGATVSLSSFRGKKPVALIFGSYT